MDTPLYTLENYSSAESVGFLLKRTGCQLTLGLDRALAAFEMTHAQFGIVMGLLHAKAKTAADLARLMMTDTGAMTRMLDRLEEKGFLSRERSHEDRRMVLVVLTLKGQELADRMTQAAVEVLNHHLQGFSVSELAQFKDFLRRMIANGGGLTEGGCQL